MTTGVCPKCEVGELTLKTVRKEGPNTGKKFYSCSDREGCNYFSWVEESGSSLKRPIKTESVVNPAQQRKGLEFVQEKDKRIAWL